MGVYYIIVNHAKKQFIEPGDINNGPVKLPSIIASKTANVLCHALTWAGLWADDAVTFLGDGDDYYYDLQEEYEDVTKKLVDDYNQEADRFADPAAVRAEYTGRECCR